MGHNICFEGVIWKIIPKLCLLPLLIWNTGKLCDEFSNFQGKEAGCLPGMRKMDGWMTYNFTSFSTVFQSYQDNGWVLMKGVQWKSVYD